jgi:hypothetical protein
MLFGYLSDSCWQPKNPLAPRNRTSKGRLEAFIVPPSFGAKGLATPAV